MRNLFGIAILIIIWSTTDAVFTQTNTGELSGVVQDISGGVLPGASVVATHSGSGLIVERVTDGNGRFFLSDLPAGSWSLTISLTGFQQALQKEILVNIGSRRELNYTLDVGTLSETVTVESSVPLIQATSAEISDVIQTEQIEQTPINGRNFISLAQLSDMVVVPPGGTRGAALQQTGPLPNVGGQRAGHNIYLLDGVKITDEYFNNLVINPSMDSVREFKIQKTLYPAEFGGKASALINVSTKSGYNTFSGTAFTFLRDERFDSHNYFDDPDEPVPPLGQYQFGGSVGGAIIPDRTHFFASYEGQRTDRSSTRTFSVPSHAVRGGDFRGYGPICDPLTRDSVSGACGQVFTENQIPVSRLDPLALALLGQVPAPTSPGEVQNLTAIRTLERRLTQFSARVDHQFGPNDRMFVRMSTFEANELQPFGTSVLEESLVPGFGRTLTTSAKNIVVSHSHVFSSRVLNEIRFGWMRVSGGQQSLNQGNRFAGMHGLQGVTDDPRDMGFPQVSTAGLYSVMGDPTMFISRNNEHFELYENLLVDLGRHRLKFGAYVFHFKFRPVGPDSPRGDFTYNGQFSGNAMADFLLGYPASARAGVGGRGAEDARTTWVHSYFQDDWQLSDSFTLNMGLRYEFNQHMRDTQNQLSTIDLSVPGGRFVIASDATGRISPEASPLLPLIPIPWVASADIGWDRSLLRPSHVRLAPRFGFAWNVGRAADVVIRGGYGVFLNQWAYSVQTGLARNLPFFFLKQVDVPTEQAIPSLRTSDILTASATGNIGGSIMDHDYQVEYTQTWSGGVQAEILKGTIFDVFYMGSYTVGADNSTIRNVPEPGPGSLLERRAIPELAGIRAIRFDGQSIFHAVTLKAERRLTDLMSFNVSYTLSRSKDDASSPGATAFEANVPQDVRNIFPGEEALSSFDHRHQFVASGSYEFPFFRTDTGWRGQLLKDWRINAIVMFQTGAPFTVNLTEDWANVGSGPAQRPNLVGDPNLPGHLRTSERWFNTEAFQLQDRFTFGDAGRNIVFAPSFSNIDLALQKSWYLESGSVIEFRWEVFNVLNAPNFGIPNRFFGTPNFGRIFRAGLAREMQFGARFRF
tara:strand:- start:8605 stop:11874 length:3270 start_codon:yes stop_codon:yes gene_type:complete